MANVLFKRGVQSGLPQGSNIVDGALYFTTDTKRLFLGNNGSNGLELLPIAEGITTVNSATSLPNAADHAGEFYYIKPADAAGDAVGNVLAYSDGTRWLQVNRSSHVTNISFGTVSQTGVVVTGGPDGEVATFTEILEQDGVQNLTASFQIKDGGNVTLARGENGELLISVPDDQNTLYSVSTSSISGGGAQIDLTPSDANGTASAVKLTSAGGITITRTASDAISFGVDASGVGAVNVFDLGYGNGVTGASSSSEGFYGRIDLSNSDFKMDTINPSITYGELDTNNNNAPTQTAKFINGVAALDVYTRSDVDKRLDNLELALDAMTYCGTISAMPSGSGIHNGDAWKASQTFSYLPTGAADAPENYVNVPAGSLVIARGTEDAATGEIISGLEFDVISGDATDTTYAINKVTHGINVEAVSGNLGIIGGISLATATDSPVTLTDDNASGSARVVTVGLSPITVGTNTAASTTTSQQKGQALTVTHIKNIETDGYGRITNLVTETATVIDTNNTISQVSFTTSTSTTNAVAVTARVDESGGTFSQDVFTLKSTGSISVAAATKEVTIDVVWGSF